MDTINRLAPFVQRPLPDLSEARLRLERQRVEIHAGASPSVAAKQNALALLAFAHENRRRQIGRDQEFKFLLAEVTPNKIRTP
jgi:hypothetical protein